MKKRISLTVPRRDGTIPGLRSGAGKRPGRLPNRGGARERAGRSALRPAQAGRVRDGGQLDRAQAFRAHGHVLALDDLAAEARDFHA